jgi:pantoate--beta-alanine ligase
MILFKKSADLHKWVEDQRKKQKTIGFVPTMGALHPGHLSLVQEARLKTEITVSSIFINPTQFNDPADFKKYPVTLEKDIDMLEEAGNHVLFLPEVNEIYPDGLAATHQYDLGYIETVLEGKYRPGHFQGVCQVVQRLLEIVTPDMLFLGQKDYQQCMVLEKMIHLLNWQDRVSIVICPTLRESDGLAMSSRNMRLSAEERSKAPLLYQALNYIRRNLKPGDMNTVLDSARRSLEENGFRVDYIEIAEQNTLTPVRSWDGRLSLVALVAAYSKDVRLIDNIILPQNPAEVVN